jgi:high affinity Mn2+ porin
MIKSKLNTTGRQVALIIFILTPIKISGQENDTLKNDRLSVHAQTTVITQYKPAFRSKYSGQNSLSDKEETRTSITSTLFLGTRLWTGASIFINPEIAGGSGLSSSLGVGASTNGETYRIGNPAPEFELARLFFRQIFPINQNYEYNETDINSLEGKIPTKYFSLTIGKISITDLFDNNSYSHNPTTQFMSWALMSNGAWDYPANTKGYTPSIVLEYISKHYQMRYGFSLVSEKPNGIIMNWNIDKAGSHSLEFSDNFQIGGKAGTIRLLSFLTTANMGSYSQSLANDPTAPDITTTEKHGRTKYGFGINGDLQLNRDLGVFFRAGWNDGKNETWEFTEIDRTVSLGMSLNGNKWHRQNDNIALAYVVSGISLQHRRYLEAGGKGFELGDGNLNYGLENLVEFYYSMHLEKNIFVSAAYQFLCNPGYNKDRGPVNIFSLRLHLMV